MKRNIENENKITSKILQDNFRYESGVLFWKKRRSGVKVNTPAGCIGKGYCNIMLNRKRLRRSRIVFRMFKGFWPNEIDHINRIKDDDRIENLRDVSHLVNMQNRGPYKNRNLLKAKKAEIAKKYQCCYFENVQYEKIKKKDMEELIKEKEDEQKKEL